MGPAYIKSKLPPSFTALPELRPNDAFEKLAINFAELLERSIDAFSNCIFQSNTECLLAKARLVIASLMIC